MEHFDGTRTKWRSGSGRLGLAVLGLVLVAVVAAQAGSPLLLELERFLVLQEERDGETVESLVPAFQLQPGDVMLETLTASNVSSEPLREIQLVVPIAPQTNYVDGTAALPKIGEMPVAPEFSFDSGLTFGRPPLKRTIVVIEGGLRKEREVAVVPEEYTHVRWTIPSLEPYQDVQVGFRAVVE